MNYRRILVPLESADAIKSLMEQAKGLFANEKVHFDAMRANVFSEPQLPAPLITSWPMVGGFSSLAMIDGGSAPEMQDYLKRYKKDVEELRQEFRDVFAKSCKDLGIEQIEYGAHSNSQMTSSWIARKDKDEFVFSDNIIAQARFSDLVVAARPAERDDIWLSAVVNNVLFDASQPLLLLPVGDKTRKFNGYPKRIAIAWNGSNESAHAVKHAIPMIAEAEEVFICTSASTKTAAETADDLAYWLSKYDAKVKTIVFNQHDVTSVGAALLAECERYKIDLLVSGAYSHSRLRSFVLGGVTTYLLTHSDVPLLMSH